MWIYISASMVLTIDWQQRIQQPDFQLQNGAAKVCCRNFIRASCFSILRKDLLYFIKKEDLDDKFLKNRYKDSYGNLTPDWKSAREYTTAIMMTRLKCILQWRFSLDTIFYSKDPIHIYQDQTLCTFPYSIYQNLQLQLTGSNLLNTRDAVYSFMDYVRNEQPSYYELHSWLNKITLIIIKHCNDKKIPASCYIDYTESLQFLYNYHSLEEIESTICP